MTRKAANEYVGLCVTNGLLSGFRFEQLKDVFVDMRLLSPMRAVNVACVLLFSGWLELVAERNLERGAMDGFEAEAKAANPCKKFDDVKFFLLLVSLR